MTAETDAMWAEFERSLVWQPIGEYDQAEGHVVLFRDREDDAIGYWEAGKWWHAQESLQGLQLPFEPAEFAEVGEKWRVELMAD